MNPQFRKIEDASLRQTVSLPAAASATVHTAVIDIDKFSVLGAGGGSDGASGQRPPKVEPYVGIPALSTTILPDTKTATLTIENSDDATFGSGVTTLITKVVTGAGGVGSGTLPIEAQVVLPPNAGRYLRGSVAFGANTTDGSALKAYFGLRF